MIYKNSNETEKANNLESVNEHIKNFTPQSKNLEEGFRYDDENEREIDYKQEILKSALHVSNKINESMLREEKNKLRARVFFMIFLSIILFLSIGLISIMIYLCGIGKLAIDNSIIIGSFVYVIANTFALMQILIKYISENKLLDTFEKVTQRLLEFLVNEKKEKQ